MIEFIERNGAELMLGPDGVDDAVSTMVGVVAGNVSEQDSVEWVEARVRVG